MMIKLLNKYIQAINGINDWLGSKVAWLNVLLILLIGVDVVLRYVFNTGFVALGELEWHLFALIFLLCMGYSLRHDQHVRVDVFYNQFSERAKAWVNLLGAIFMLLPFCVVCIYAGFKFGYYSFQFREGSPNPGGLPALYLIKSMIAVGFVFLLLQSFSLIFSAWLVLLGQRTHVFEQSNSIHSSKN